MQKLSSSSESQYEPCIICFQLLNQPMRCSTCKKYVCRSHTVNLDKCPNCRKEPFAPTFDQHLEESLRSIRQAKRQTEKMTTDFTCCAKNCNFKGGYNKMVDHHKTLHPYLPLNMVLYGDYYEIQDQAIVQNVTEAQGAKAAFACQNERKPPAGEKKKSVDFFKALRMIRHCNICQNTQCHTLFTGPWGSFIGGTMGKTHFDLTTCPKGKQFNIEAGWNYDDYRN